MEKFYLSLINKYTNTSLVVLLLIISFFAYSAKDFQLDASSDTLILEQDEDLKKYRLVIDDYGSNDFLIVTFTDEKRILTKDNLNQIKNELFGKSGVITNQFKLISTKPENDIFEKLTNFLDKKPNWLMKGQILKKWFGIRSRPDGEPSPIMKNLENGLFICTGFYKNGILLAPACSKWVANEIKNYLC